nr:SH3 domain-containing protein [Bacillus cereus group sp. BfR-BA-01700]MDX5840163.1 SH3 domain-containing protein [Bacillus cereus group sp. BfR-BA-01700]
MIFILTKNAKQTFPVTPSGIGPKGGGVKLDEVQTLKYGAVPFTDGLELEEVSWTSFFSFNKIYGEEVRHDPHKAVAVLTEIKEAEEPVLLCITELNYQKEMILKSFEYWIDKPGYIEYSIVFREHKEIKLAFMNEKGEITRPPSKNLDKYVLKTAKVTGAGMVAVRDSPSPNGKIIGTIKEGSTITLGKDDKGQNGFVTVQFSNVHGFISKNYIG